MKTITPFMLELLSKLMKERNVTESTASQYIKTLYSLNNQRPFTNLAWLKNKDSVNTRLSEFAQNTQKSILGSIVSVLSLYKDGTSYKKIYSYWYNEMQSKRIITTDSSIKTQKEEENWLDWDIVLSHKNRLAEECSNFDKLKELTPVQYEHLLHYLVISLFTDIPPRRNQDYQYMLVVKKLTGKEDQNMNYLCLDSKQFVFNKYKTSKTHGQQIFDIPDTLMDVIQLYLKFNPLNRSKSYYFLVNYNCNPILVVNGITRILNKIFGKNVGASMLRHIYLSNKYNIDEMEDDAEAMAHGLTMQREYLKSDTQYVDVPEYKSKP
jgi:hypothetical protein